MIPKVVYFTHENTEKKNIFRKDIYYNKKNNNELVFEFYDDKMRGQFIREYYPDFYKFYIRIHPDYGAVKADIFRVLILYHNCGIYVDIKTRINNIYKYISKTKKSFYIGSFKNEDKILHYFSKLSFAYYSNWFIATEKKGKLITEIKEEMYKRLSNFNEKNSFQLLKYPFVSGTMTSGRLCTWYTTGPILFTEVIAKSQSDIGIISDTKILIYDGESNSFNRFLNKNYKNTYHYSKNNLLM